MEDNQMGSELGRKTIQKKRVYLIKCCKEKGTDPVVQPGVLVTTKMSMIRGA
jgi:hypothetical protein